MNTKHFKQLIFWSIFIFGELGVRSSSCAYNLYLSYSGNPILFPSVCPLYSLPYSTYIGAHIFDISLFFNNSLFSLAYVFTRIMQKDICVDTILFFQHESMILCVLLAFYMVSPLLTVLFT